MLNAKAVLERFNEKGIPALRKEMAGMSNRDLARIFDAIEREWGISHRDVLGMMKTLVGRSK